MSVQMIGAILDAIWQTIEMVIIPSFMAVIIGLPLGVILFVTPKNNYYPELF
ncbi:hypothetical protein [Candidatus Coxiella mudrowiae]|uniref:hypothetical protein n=1 Tax=Candidatus Coxiella mudrowiae TaxID=2054173 RepID=UPI000AB37780|nr:hypothetical protein [Candidatus Coxiella mudrowiae]